MKKNRLAIWVLLAAILVVCFFAFPLTAHEVKMEGNEEEGPNVPTTVKSEPVLLKIACVGDVMVHKSQIPAQYDSGAGTYDYGNNFQYVKDYIEGADLSLCNLETTFGGEPYAGYPNFSAPDQLAHALRETGFSVAITANNHMMDRGLVGLKRTLDVLQGNGLLTTGSRLESTEPTYVIAETKGVKIGIVAYTYATSGSSGGLLINGSAVSEEAASLINYFRYAQLDEDLQKVKQSVDQAKAAGAQIIIVYYHWGEEYQLKANQWQRDIAEWTVNNMDVDMIFASHPHTLQEMEMMKKEGVDKQVPVFFSMGNFISNQRQETLDNRYTEIGIIARVELEYNPDEKEILSIQMDAIPTWVEKYKSGGKDVYAIIPLDEHLDSNEELAMSGHLARAKRALEDANGILGSN